TGRTGRSLRPPESPRAAGLLAPCPCFGADPADRAAPRAEAGRRDRAGGAVNPASPVIGSAFYLDVKVSKRYLDIKLPRRESGLPPPPAARPVLTPPGAPPPTPPAPGGPGRTGPAPGGTSARRRSRRTGRSSSRSHRGCPPGRWPSAPPPRGRSPRPAAPP